MKKSIIFLLLLLCAIFSGNAQIGYQVSLLDAATGQPRADETVSVRIDLTDNSGTTICSETKLATSDEFGVLSLTIGNASTFNDVDWSKLPFFISATVDGILLGKSQVLSVPVAEYAKRTGTLTKEILMSKTWDGNLEYFRTTISFNNSTAIYRRYQYDIGGWGTPIYQYTFNYKIMDDSVVLYNSETGRTLSYTGSTLLDINELIILK